MIWAGLEIEKIISKILLQKTNFEEEKNIHFRFFLDPRPEIINGRPLYPGGLHSCTFDTLAEITSQR